MQPQPKNSGSQRGERSEVGVRELAGERKARGSRVSEQQQRSADTKLGESLRFDTQESQKVAERLRHRKRAQQRRRQRGSRQTGTNLNYFEKDFS